MGFGSGTTCWQHLRDWNEAELRQRLHEALITELNATARIDWSLRGHFLLRQGAKGWVNTGPSLVDRDEPTWNTT